MRKLFLLLFVLIPLFSVPSFSAENITVQSMISLKNLDFSEDDIKKQIDQSDAPYTLTDDEKQTLKQAGFTDSFIQYLTGFKPGAKPAAASAPGPQKQGSEASPSEKEGNPLPSGLPAGLPETGGAPPAIDNPAPESENTPSANETVSSDASNDQNGQNTDSSGVQTPDQRLVLVGMWKATLYYQGAPNGTMTVQFYENGYYSSLTQYGYQQTSVTGSYQVQNGAVSGRTEMGQYFSYPYSLNENQLVLVMPEWGGQVFFFRQY